MPNVRKSSAQNGNGNGTVHHDVDQVLAIEDGWQKLSPHSVRLLTSKETLNAQGTIGELLTAIDLLSRGYEPYYPLPGRNAKYDLLAVHRETGDVLKLSVKTTAEGSGSQASHFRGGQVSNAHSAFIRYLGPNGWGLAECKHCLRTFMKRTETQELCSPVCKKYYKPENNT